MKLLRTMAERSHRAAEARSEAWLRGRLLALPPGPVLEIGAGDGRKFHACVNGTHYMLDAGRDRRAVPGLDYRADLNGIWSFDASRFDCVFGNQVLEHLHHTRFALREAWRVLRPGGLLLFATENLASAANVLALACGWAPFSLQRVGGLYCGNPLGLHRGERVDILTGAGTESGVLGHNRVLCARQATELLEDAGFVGVRATTLGWFPLPDGAGRLLERLAPLRGHLMHLEARKP